MNFSVLTGSQTAYSKWVKYEIAQSIKKEIGLLGVYIHADKEKSQMVVYTDETSI